MKIKPGHKTTEFWLSLLGVALAGLVLYGVISQSEADTVLTLARDLLFGSGALVSIVAMVRFYIEQRGALKAMEIEKAQNGGSS